MKIAKSHLYATCNLDPLLKCKCYVVLILKICIALSFSWINNTSFSKEGIRLRFVHTAVRPHICHNESSSTEPSPYSISPTTSGPGPYPQQGYGAPPPGQGPYAPGPYGHGGPGPYGTSAQYPPGQQPQTVYVYEDRRRQQKQNDEDTCLAMMAGACAMCLCCSLLSD
ncbi:Hypothetical predicted protein [Paramuricea clavata]|uniref:Uncharacterized protein n=1 Tax=Paramuricea clavata TaxID=317549 RepID=A0A6S7FJV2_PARCT|nr:Hypothetical predicted protein [Paramuricea clavata]